MLYYTTGWPSSMSFTSLNSTNTHYKRLSTRIASIHAGTIVYKISNQTCLRSYYRVQHKIYNIIWIENLKAAAPVIVVVAVVVNIVVQFTTPTDSKYLIYSI